MDLDFEIKQLAEQSDSQKVPDSFLEILPVNQGLITLDLFNIPLTKSNNQSIVSGVYICVPALSKRFCFPHAHIFKKGSDQCNNHFWIFLTAS